ncbi:MAG: tRNA pseudouridine(55) synthase TruB [Planctomycetota bacterium]
MTISGLIVVNKPERIHTGTIVEKIKKRFRLKVGHTGVLDYIGSGVILLLINKATKICDFLINCDKEYIFTGLLGKRTDTMDITGVVLEEKVCDSSITVDRIVSISQEFTGKILLPVPLYSNKKLNGVPLYKLKKKNQNIPQLFTQVVIYNLSPVEINIPYFTFRVKCSKGTYIRSLIDVIGQKLGVGATMYAIKRIAVGNFSIEQAIEFDKLLAMDFDTFRDNIIPLHKALEFLPEIEISRDYIFSFCNGNEVPVITPVSSISCETVRVTFMNELLGVGKLLSYAKKLYVRPVKVLTK